MLKLDSTRLGQLIKKREIEFYFFLGLFFMRKFHTPEMLQHSAKRQTAVAADLRAQKESEKPRFTDREKERERKGGQQLQLRKVTQNHIKCRCGSALHYTAAVWLLVLLKLNLKFKS